jgi:NAD(P)-dependent dehydrogenase (short-subunit alcohol dehydrogenase family)
MASQDQSPLPSGFGHASTATQVLKGISLEKRNFVVTGGYSGIGLETVRALAAAGARVTVRARSRERAESARGSLGGAIEIAEMDLADLASVRKFAREFVATGRPLQGLINNAGVMACPLARLGDGWESQFAICHLGHFELARGLETPLKNAEGARVVALSSIAHARGDIIWHDIHFRARPYDKWAAYGQAKTADALFALGLDRRWKSDGVRAFSVHPGGIFTPLQRHLGEEEMVALGWKAADGSIPPQVQALFKSPEAGAATSVWCATSPKLAGRGGVYCEDCDIAKLAGPESQRWEHVRPWACDDASADRLWSVTESMLGAGG